VARTVDLALLDGVGRGRIEAAAGCGKTEAIVQLTSAWTGRRTLILTHTLAGVAALRRRLQNARVSPTRFSLASIDAWCVRRVGEFPLRAGPLPDAANPRVFYPAVRAACLQLLASNALDAALQNTYGRVFVDEYQDCGPVQHAIVCQLARLLPTLVVGDPLQAVFGFAGVADWQQDVVPTFPLVETLDHPWRWERVGAGELGQWLVAARTHLQDGTGIDLAQLPAGCEWRLLSGDVRRDAPVIRTATSYWQRGTGSVLVLANPRIPGRHAEMARSGEGMQVVENLDLVDLMRQVTRLEQAEAAQRLRPLLAIADSVMTGMAIAELTNRCEILGRGRARSPPTPDEVAALTFLRNPDWSQARDALRVWSVQPGRRVFRREVLELLLDSLDSAASGRQPSLLVATASARERRRHRGRPVSARAIGSTLLLKGLEADYTVLLDVEELSVQDLYVALTRGTRGMLVLSQQQRLASSRR
jgi:hypothetical protein